MTLCLLALSACGSGGSEELTGAGAISAGPLVQLWSGEYEKSSGVEVSYRATGSQDGLAKLKEGKAAFAATDEAVEPGNGPGSVVPIPVAFEAVVIAYNLPDYNELKLTPEALAGIFSGRITRWNDPTLVADNPPLASFDSAIDMVHRSDENQTTGLFTEFLSRTNAEWRAGVGSGTAVDWPTGTGFRGNGELTRAIRANPHAIGYMDFSQVIRGALKHASIKNTAGRFVTASAASATAAGEGSDLPQSGVGLLGATAEAAYPIVGVLSLLVPPDPSSNSGALSDFVSWALSDGQEMVTDRFYAPLPAGLATRVRAQAESVLAVEAVGTG